MEKNKAIINIDLNNILSEMFRNNSKNEYIEFVNDFYKEIENSLQSINPPHLNIDIQKNVINTSYTKDSVAIINGVTIALSLGLEYVLIPESIHLLVINIINTIKKRFANKIDKSKKINIINELTVSVEGKDFSTNASLKTSEKIDGKMAKTIISEIMKIENYKKGDDKIIDITPKI
jgi:hypothetical protein